MAEEQQTAPETPAPEGQPPTSMPATADEIVKPAPAAKADEPPDGKEFVDIPDGPLKARFNRVYASMKQYERGLTGLAKHNELLQQALETVLREQKIQGAAGTISDLQNQIVAARANGDVATELALQQRLNATQAQAELEIKKPALPPPPQMEDPAMPRVNEWVREVDQAGNFVRPWAMVTHPRYKEAERHLAQLATDPTMHGDVERMLAAVDQRMGLARAQPQQAAAPRGRAAVLTGGGAGRAAAATSLSPEERRVAARMGISEDKYREQVDLIRQVNYGSSR